MLKKADTASVTPAPPLWFPHTNTVDVVPANDDHLLMTWVVQQIGSLESVDAVTLRNLVTQDSVLTRLLSSVTILKAGQNDCGSDQAFEMARQWLNKDMPDIQTTSISDVSSEKVAEFVLAMLLKHLCEALERALRQTKVWTFIDQSTLSDTSYHKIRQLLCSWYQTITLEYLPVCSWMEDGNDFLTSWKTGAILLLILHYSDPNCVELECAQEARLATSQSNMRSNVSNALNIALKRFGVKRRLTESNVIHAENCEISTIIYLCELCIATVSHADDFRDSRQKQIFDKCHQAVNEVDDLARVSDLTIVETPDSAPPDIVVTLDNLEDYAINIRQMVSILRVKMDDCVPRRSIAFRREDPTLGWMRDRAATPSTFSEASGASASVDDDDTASLQSTRTVHPLQAMDEDKGSYKMTLDNTIHAIQAYRKHDINKFYAAAHELQISAPSSKQRVLGLVNSIDELDQTLEQDIIIATDAFQLFDRGYGFSKQAKSIRFELDFIQAKMVKTTTTNTGITELENRAQHAYEDIGQLEQSFDDLLDADSTDQSYRNILESLVQKYELVQAWVEEVRIWFAEAERIRNWIESRIQMLEEKEVEDSLAEKINTTQTEVAKLNDDHEALEHEIESFNKEDMTRLRAHVKALTGSEKGDKDLSPADTTTIEITLTTLMTLDRLMHLLRQKTHTLQVLSIRVLWEAEYATATKWVEDGHAQTTLFVIEEARWRADTDMRTVSNDGSEQFLPRDDSIELRTQVINSLLALEHSIADFDQGQFTSTLEIFQDFEDIIGDDKPQHLESRQAGLEASFQTLTSRVQFARKVVEQRLTMMEFIQQYVLVRTEGQLILHDLENMIATITYTMQSTDNIQRVQTFRNNLTHLTGFVAGLVTYPPHNCEMDEASNDRSNDEIFDFLEARNSELEDLYGTMFSMLDKLGQLIQDHKEAHAIQLGLQLMNDQLSESQSELLRSPIDIAVKKLKLTENDVKKWNEKQNDRITHFEISKDTEFDSLKIRLEKLSSSCDRQTCTIDFAFLDNEVSRLTIKFDEFSDALNHQNLLLEALNHRLNWETSFSTASQQISEHFFKIMEYAKMSRWYPTEETRVNKEDISNIAKWKQTITDSEQQMKAFQNDTLMPAARLATILLASIHTIELKSNIQTDQSFVASVQQQQSELAEKFEDLYSALDYHRALVEQKNIILELLRETEKFEDTGMSCLDQMKRLIEHGLQHRYVDFSGQIKEFSRDVEELFTNRIAKLPPIQCSQLKHLTSLSNDNDRETNTAIGAFFDSRKEEVQKLISEMKDMQSKYIVTQELKSKVSQYEQDAANLCHWILLQSESLAECKQELKCIAQTLDHDRLDTLINLQNERYEQVDGYARKELDNLSANISELATSIAEVNACNVDMSPASSTYDLAVADMAILIHAMEGHGRNIDARKQHLVLQQLLSDSQNEANKFQIQITELSNQLDTLTQNDESGVFHQTTVLSISKQCEDIDVELIAFDNRVGAEIRSSLSDLERLCSQLLEPVAPPADLSNRIIEFDDGYIRLRENTSSLRARIQVVMDFKNCLEKADSIYAWYHEQEDVMERFLADTARWNPATGSAQVNINQISEGIDSIKISVDIYESQHIEPCLVALDEIKTSIAETSFVNLIDRLEIAKTSLQGGIQKLHDHIAFGETIIAQNRSATWYLARVNEMQMQAEAIRANLIEHKNDSTYQLDDLNVLEAQMPVTLQESNMRITYPVRSFDGFRNEGAEKDVKTNELLSETVRERNHQLQQIMANIKEIVHLNDVRMKQYYLVQQYSEQADSLKLWISDQTSNLQRVMNTSADATLDETKALLANIHTVSKDLEAHQSTYEELKARSLETTRLLLMQGASDEGSREADVAALADSIDQAQRGIDNSWDTMTDDCIKAIVRLEADFDAKQLGESLQELLKQLGVLNEDISAAEEDTSNEMANDWTDRLATLLSQPLASLKEQDELLKLKRKECDIPSYEKNELLFNQIDQQIVDVNADIEKLAEIRYQNELLENHLRNGSQLINDVNEINCMLTPTITSLWHLTGDDTVDSATQVSMNTIMKEVQSRFTILEQKCAKYCDSSLSTHESPIQQKSDLEKALSNFNNQILQAQKIAQDYENAFAQQKMFNNVMLERLPKLDNVLRDASVTDSDLTNVTQDLGAVREILQEYETIQSSLVGMAEPQNEINCQQLEACYAEIRANLERREAEVLELKTKSYKAAPLAEFQRACTRLRDLCKEQSRLLNNTMEATGKSQFYIKDITFLERLLRQNISIHSNVERELKLLRSQTDVQSAELEQLDAGPELHTYLEGAREELEQLQTILDTDQKQIDFVRKIFAFAKASSQIYAWMEGCKRAIRGIDTDSLNENEQQSDLTDLSIKMNGFEPTMTAFNNMVSAILKDKNDEPVDLSEIQMKSEDVSAAVNMRSGRVLGEWDALKKQYALLQWNSESSIQGTTIARKSKEIMALVDKIKSHLRSLSVTRVALETPVIVCNIPLLDLLSEREVIVVETQMNNLEREVEYQLNKKIDALDQIIALSTTLQDGTFVQQRAHIAQVVNELVNMMQEKHQEITVALKIAGFVGKADEVEVLLSAIQETVDPCVAQTKTERLQSKADLQALLIELDARFKYYGPRIREKLEETKDMAHTFEDNERVTQKFTDIEKRWNGLREQANQAKLYLTSKIAGLSATTPSPRYMDHQGPPRPHSVADVRTRKISEKTIARAMTPNPRSSTSSQMSTRGLGKLDSPVTRMRRATHTPMTSRSGKAASVPPRYIPDPKSDLDVQLGKVVNESPYKIRIKMVPGEVGKYWFGDIEPRLVYCRILRSNMVMVRVGGGWTELSQFLRDHALLEGRLIPNRFEEEKRVNVRDAYLRTKPKPKDVNTQEDLKKSGSDPIKSSRSAPNRATNNAVNQAGIKEGNRFLMTVDGQGNQLEISMKKATDHEPRLHTSTPRRSQQ
ncbi:hypothetical protein INT43_001871 [Umbelopsis isabellina]|uniref:GAR domain-containing protein n=1 Tax=Mortierella isabellina TaxID=91625 RepID=A0A8H7PRM7_MORIS|nr:hypothetical protein INT43_001871 [Umbelopsis isabellina]